MQTYIVTFWTNLDDTEIPPSKVQADFYNVEPSGALTFYRGKNAPGEKPSQAVRSYAAGVWRSVA